MTNDTLDVLFTWAYPGTGKSELFEFLRSLSREELAALNLGPDLVFIDDYTMVAALQKADIAREAAGEPRKVFRAETYHEGGFLHPEGWDVLNFYQVMRHAEAIAEDPDVYTHATVLIECARGGPEGNTRFPLPHGYQRVLDCFPVGVVESSAALYIDVPPEVAAQKNDERCSEEQAALMDTIVHHVPTGVMRDCYGSNDIAWMEEQARTAGRDGYVQSSGGILVPTGHLVNVPDQTSWVRDASVIGEARERAAAGLRGSLEAVLPVLKARYDVVRAEREAE